MHATAKQVWRMTTDCDDERKFVSFCDLLSVTYLGEELDSKDLGDALGALIAIGTKENELDSLMSSWVFPADGFSVTLSFDWELFDWESPIPPHTIELRP
jgi:hypothetical protein